MHKECTHTAVHRKSMKGAPGLSRMHKDVQEGCRRCTGMPRRCKKMHGDAQGRQRRVPDGAWGVKEGTQRVMRLCR